VFLLASGPVGWGALLVGALSVSGGGAAAAWGGTHLGLSYGRKLNEKSESEMTLGGQLLLNLSSPGGIAGMTAGAFFADGGNIDPVLTGGSVGGFVEGAWSLARGIGRMGAMEAQYGLPDGRYGIPVKTWDDRRDLYLMEAFGFSDPASRARANPSFPKGIERIELSHWIPKRWTRWAASFFDRPWNLRAVWGAEHALIDGKRFGFMGRAWRTANPAYGKFASSARLMPEWARDATYGSNLLTRNWFGDED